MVRYHRLRLSSAVQTYYLSLVALFASFCVADNGHNFVQRVPNQLQLGLVLDLIAAKVPSFSAPLYISFIERSTLSSLRAAVSSLPQCCRGRTQLGVAFPCFTVRFTTVPGAWLRRSQGSVCSTCAVIVAAVLLFVARARRRARVACGRGLAIFFEKFFFIIILFTSKKILIMHEMT